MGLALGEAITNLPEPVLILGNRIPDADSLGSAAAVLDALFFEDKKAYIHCVEKPVVNIAWMLNDTNVREDILDRYESLLVVDDCVDSTRLGVPIKEGIPIVCVDHHIGNKPDLSWEYLGLNSSSVHVFQKDNVITFWKDVPATACILIDEDIIHPYLWLSIYTDTVNLTKRGISGARYIEKLRDKLEVTSFLSSLTDRFQDEMYQRFNLLGGLEEFDALYNGDVHYFRGISKRTGEEISIIVASVYMGEADFKHVLGTFRCYAQVVCLIDRETGKGSLRTEIDDYNMLEIARSVGGGGHIKASGFKVDPKGVLFTKDKIETVLLNNLVDIDCLYI